MFCLESTLRAILEGSYTSFLRITRDTDFFISYLNPAITFSNCLFRGLPWRSFPLLTLSQILGSFCGTGITYGVYLPAINQFSGGLLHAPPSAQATASIFTSFPQAFSSRTSEVFSVIQRTAIMQCVVAALKDDYNLGQKVSSGGSTNFPLNLFFLFFGLTAAFGWQTGYVGCTHIIAIAGKDLLTAIQRASKPSS